MANEVEYKLTADANDILKSLAQISTALAEIQTQTKKNNEESKKRFASEGAAATKLASGIDRLQKEYVDLGAAAAKLRTALKNTTDERAIASYTKALAKAEVGMARLEQTAKKTGVSLKQSNKELSTGKEVVQNFVGALTKATIIIAVVDAVARFTKELVGFSASMQKAEKQFENFTGSAESAEKVVASLLDFSNRKFLDTQEVLDSGKALLAFGISADNLEPVLGRIADISAATGKNFQELAVIYGKARAAGVLYAEDINQLVDAGIPIIGEFAKQFGVSESEIKKMASEGKISFERLELAFYDLTAAGAAFSGQAEAQAETLGGAWRSLSSSFLTAFKPIGDFLTDVLVGGLREAASSIELYSGLFKGLSFSEAVEKADEAVYGIESSTTRIGKAFDALDKELLTGQKTQTQNILFIDQERRKLLEAAEKKDLELRKTNNKKVLEEQRKAAEERRRFEEQQEKLRVDLIADETERAVQLERLKFESLTDELRKYFTGTKELDGLLLRAQEDYQANVAEIRAKALADQAAAQLESVALTQKYIDEIKKASQDEKKTVIDLATDSAKLSRDNALQSLDLLKAQNEGTLIELKKQGVEEAKIADAQREFDALDKLARLQTALRFQQDLLSITGEGNAEQAAQIEAQIALLEQQISNAISEAEIPEGEGKSFFSKFIESLGLEDADIQALTDAAGQIVGAIESITAARVADSEAALKAAEDRTKAAEDQLDRELELSEQGFASNVTIAQQTLELAKKAEADALKEKQKAVKAQLALDAAQQLSAIVVSSANLFKANTPLGPIGVIAAIAQIATMFAVLASTRAKARAAAQFGEGGEAGVSSDSIVTGPSHARGGVGIEVEGGEFMTSDGKKISIVKKHMTKKHFALLRAVNEDNTPEIARIAAQISAGAANMPTLDTNAGERVASSVSSSVALRRDKEAEQMKEQNALLRENNRLLRQIKDKENAAWEDSRYRYERRGTKTTVTRK